LTLALVFGLLAILGAVGIVLWLSGRPAAPPPQPIQEPARALFPARVASETPPTAVGTGDRAAAEEEPAGEVERPIEAGPVTAAARRAADAVPPAAPGVEEPFPAHFREGTALFWFDDDGVRDAFLERLRAGGAGRTVRLTGHATESEVAAGRGSLGLSRSWAVRKWLVRQGWEPERIATARGRNVPDRGAFDGRGFPLNQWVTVTIE
jgi:outer membrane protein OmpA-like peptidoglycan-associated protein